MTHPITPPPELVAQWFKQAHESADPDLTFISTAAAQWGADKQLEECVAWLDGYEREGWAAEQMRNDCRPKPPSLKEQALRELDDIYNDEKIDGHAYRTIFQALEALPND